MAYIGTLVLLCLAADQDRARDLYQRLSTDGFSPWLHWDDVLAGQDLHDETWRVVRDSLTVLVCVSESNPTLDEDFHWQFRCALETEERRPDRSSFLVPVRLDDDCDVPDRLHRLQRIDLFRPDGYKRLLRSLCHIRDG